MPFLKCLFVNSSSSFSNLHATENVLINMTKECPTNLAEFYGEILEEDF